MGVGAFLLGVAASLVAAILWAELDGWGPQISRRLLDAGVRRLPFMHRARLREEWSAYLDDMPTTFSQLIAALGFLWAAQRMRIWDLRTALRAIHDYYLINRITWQHRMSARKFAATRFTVRFVRWSCGNRHLVCYYRLPARLAELCERYQDIVPDELGEEVPAEGSYAASMAIVEEAGRLRASARRSGRAHPAGDAALGEMVDGRWVTNLIALKTKDTRPVRLLMAWLWRRRRSRRSGR